MAEFCEPFLSSKVSVCEGVASMLQGELTCFVHHRGHYQKLADRFICIFSSSSVDVWTWLLQINRVQRGLSEILPDIEERMSRDNLH